MNDLLPLVTFVAGAAVSAASWRTMGEQFRTADVVRRRNYRDHELPVASGVMVVLAVVAVAALWSLGTALAGSDETEQVAAVSGFVTGTLGFGLLGLLDDLVGAGAASAATKGFRGHLGALAQGQVTTGLVKLVGGVLVGVLVVPGDGWDVVRAGLVVAAAANVGNLFDRAPGRTIKASLVAGAGVVVLAAVAGDPSVGLGAVGALAGMTLVLGAGAGLLVADLRETCMLGDTGSNVLGAAVGYGLVVAVGSTGEWVALVVLVGLNVVSERVSFTRVIDATPPLRWFDRLGALPERRR
ncbi:MAG: hypothetical protein KDB40_23500 [Acidimicrobiales bacterium]|nr:hypothetical protein [Acidimicrobiales bacterium]MCB9395394.1 hypothetical protein [Acidimicrobiaceae bacterium]